MDFLEMLKRILGYDQPAQQQAPRVIPQGPTPAAPSGNYPSYPENLKSTWDGYPEGQLKHKQDIEAMFNSPLADSLIALAGHHPKMMVSQLPSSRDRGEFDSWKGELRLSDFPLSFTKSGESRNNTPASQPSTRSAFIHEMGHAAGQGGRYAGNRDEGPSFDLPKVDTTQLSPLEKAGQLNLDPYYKNNDQHERYAQAFTNAFQFLQDVAKKPDMDWRGYLAKLEGNTPGAGALVTRMIKEPIYKDHPLKSTLVKEDKDRIKMMMDKFFGPKQKSK